MGAAAIAAGLVVAAGAFMTFKNATKSATTATTNFGAVASGAFGPQLSDVQEKVKKTGGAVDTMAEKIKKASDALKSDMAAALKGAQDQLETAKGKFDDFASTVSDGLSNAFSFKDAKDAGKDSGAGFLDGLRAQVKGIQTYSKDVGSLLTMGLSQDALQAVLDAGGESGAAIAAELIKGGTAAIAETNALVQASKDAATIIGQQAASQWYGVGVSNAQSYLQGVEAAFAAAQKRLGKKGIKLADIKGISASFNDAISQPMVGSVNSVQSQSIGSGIGATNNVTINVNGGDPQAIVDALRRYMQLNGSVPIKVSN